MKPNVSELKIRAGHLVVGCEDDDFTDVGLIANGSLCRPRIA
jgi:hypothetical protein